MASTEIARRIVDALLQVIDPLVSATTDPQALIEWLAEAGLPAPEVEVLQALAAAATDTVDAVNKLADAADGIDGIAELASFLASVGKAIDSIRTFADVAPRIATGAAVQPETIALRVTQRLIVDALDRAHPAIVPSLVALGLANRWWARDQTWPPSPERVLAQRFTELELDRLPALFRDPVGELRGLYAPNGLATEAEALAAADRLMPALVEIATALGLEASYGSASHALATSGDQFSGRGALLLGFADPDDEVVKAGAGIAFASAESDGPGVAVAPFGEVDLPFAVGPWDAQVVAKATVPALLFGPNGVRFIDSTGASFSASLTLTPKADAPPWSIGVPNGTRIEIPPFGARAFVDADPALPDAGGELSLKGLRLIIAASDGDGFLKAVLPQDPMVLALELTVGGSVQKGFYIEGGAGASYTLRLHETIGPILIEAITLELTIGAEGVVLTVAVDGGLELGPLTAAVEGVGFKVAVQFGQPGNLGNANLALDFKPPTGIGLSVDAGGLVGGGFLEIDTDHGRYAGVLGLNFGDIGLTAIGIIQTKMPDGRDGFSMLISIGVIFDPPFQLSSGFTLAGVGGLIGINRNMLTEELQRGIKNRTLDSILFPDPASVVENAPKIISDLDTVFPTAEGRFVVGPMVKIGWGSPTLITADIGIFLSVPDPVSVVLMGKVEATFPVPTKPVVLIHMDVLGVLDLGRKLLSFQSSIYDSRVLAYTLLGDTAFLYKWGDNPEFALSIGGFHPKFDPPPPPIIFAGLQRLSLEMSSGHDFSLSCRGYQALTPNSLQFGARIDLHAEGGGGSVDGHLSFDALFYFSPFSMDVSISGAVAIRYQGSKLADIRLEFDLSGPTPWDARGQAHIEILFFDVDVGFHFTWGSQEQRTISSVDPLPPMIEAFSRPASWGSVLPSRAVEHLRAREGGDADELVVHPAGILEVKQRVAPLGITLASVGNAPITGHDRFTVASMQAGHLDGGGAFVAAEAQPPPIEDAQEYFARGQYESLSNHQKLSVPSFEKMPAGARSARSSALRIGGATQSRELSYESILLGEDLIAEEQGPGRKAFAGEGIHLSRRGARVAPGPARVGVGEQTWTIVRKQDLIRLDPALPGMTRARADQVLAERVAAHPALAGKLLVVPTYEAQEAA